MLEIKQKIKKLLADIHYMLPIGFVLLFAFQQVVFYGANVFSFYDKPDFYGLNELCLFQWESYALGKDST